VKIVSKFGEGIRTHLMTSLYQLPGIGRGEQSSSHDFHNVLLGRTRGVKSSSYQM